MWYLQYPEQYPDWSSSSYEYSGSLLKKITRLDAEGNERYCHEYKSYDSQGIQTICNLPGSVGQLNLSYDALSRVTSIKAPNWCCNNVEYDSVGNLISSTTLDPDG